MLLLLEKLMSNSDLTVKGKQTLIIYIIYTLTNTAKLIGVHKNVKGRTIRIHTLLVLTLVYVILKID